MSVDTVLFFSSIHTTILVVVVVQSIIIPWPISWYYPFTYNNHQHYIWLDGWEKQDINHTHSHLWSTISERAVLKYCFIDCLDPVDHYIPVSFFMSFLILTTTIHTWSIEQDPPNLVSSEFPMDLPTLRLSGSIDSHLILERVIKYHWTNWFTQVYQVHCCLRGWIQTIYPYKYY